MITDSLFSLLQFWKQQYPSLSVTVSSNKYEFALTLPTIIGAVNVAMGVFCPLSKIGINSRLTNLEPKKEGWDSHK